MERNDNVYDFPAKNPAPVKFEGEWNFICKIFGHAKPVQLLTVNFTTSHCPRCKKVYWYGKRDF